MHHKVGAQRGLRRGGDSGKRRAERRSNEAQMSKPEASGPAAPSRLPLPTGRLMNGPLTRPSAFALLQGHKFCSVTTRAARRARFQQLNTNTRAGVILCEVSLRGNVDFLYMAVHSDCVKWHTREVNHEGYSHSALLHIETTYGTVSYLETVCCH